MSTKTLTAQEIWRSVKEAVAPDVQPTFYKTWLAKTQAQLVDDSTFEVLCPNEFTIKQLDPYITMLTNRINRTGSHEPFEVVFKVGKTEQTIQEETEQQMKTPLFEQLSKKGVGSADKTTRINAGLNPTYTFENYIMGNTNRLAYAIAESISREPGRQYNPLFLYAGVGLGKTHLVQAIGNKVLDNNSNAKVLYTTGERFANELIELLRDKKRNMKEFRRKYRNLDILIVDDVQFIAGKESTQEEFFHTFNDLFMSDKQIVLASDRPPEEFKNIEERITSRFKSGIMADIQSPDYELRSAILRSRRDYEGHPITNEVIDYIAENVSTNIRELEGAFRQVIMTANSFNADEVTKEIAQQALGTVIKNMEGGRPLNVNKILKAVCNFYSVTMPEIKGKRRNKEVVIPRQIAMYLMYDMTETPFMSIGELLGGRDHTTVMHGVRKVENELKLSPRVQNEIADIKQYIFSN